jgi:hypothetical protein
MYSAMYFWPLHYMTPVSLTQREEHHAAAGKETLCAPNASLIGVDREKSAAPAENRTPFGRPAHSSE